MSMRDTLQTPGLPRVPPGTLITNATYPWEPVQDLGFPISSCLKFPRRLLFHNRTPSQLPTGPKKSLLICHVSVYLAICKNIYIMRTCSIGSLTQHATIVLVPISFSHAISCSKIYVHMSSFNARGLRNASLASGVQALREVKTELCFWNSGPLMNPLAIMPYRHRCPTPKNQMRAWGRGKTLNSKIWISRKSSIKH